MVARKVKVEDREPLPVLAAPISPVDVNQQLALVALSSIRGVGYWTLSRMAKAGTNFAAFLATEDSTEAGRTLRAFGAKLENKMADEWGPSAIAPSLEQTAFSKTSQQPEPG